MVDTPEQLVAALPPEELNALAALEPGDDEFNEFVINAFPPERRDWALRSELVTEASDGRLKLSDRGRRVIELAGERCPEPYADVTLEELLERTGRAVEELLKESPVELVPPEEYVPLSHRLASAVGSILKRKQAPSSRAPEEAASISGEENKRIARRLIEEVLSGGNLALVDELVAPTWVNHDPTSPDIRDREGLKRQIAAFRASFSDVQTTIEDQVAEENSVATRWMVRGWHTGYQLGSAPTGRQVAISVISIDRLSGGRLVESWMFRDELGMLQQLRALVPSHSVAYRRSPGPFRPE